MRLILGLLLAALGGIGLFTAAVLVLVSTSGGPAFPPDLDPLWVLTGLGMGGLIVGGLWIMKIGRDAGKV